MMAWALLAGSLGGLVLGYIGAGGTVVGLPILLYLAELRPHQALGTNAVGISLIALSLLAWRLRRGQLMLREGLAFAVPGLLGNYLGVRLGLVYPGQKLVYLLGILLFGVAAWLFYLSTRSEAAPSTTPVPRTLSTRHLLRLTPAALTVGTAAGFFAIGGGFMIVPAIALAAEVELLDAAAAALVPIAAFSGWIGAQYWAAGDVHAGLVLAMLVAGVAGGGARIALSKRLFERLTQRVFGLFLACLGAYMVMK
jgi:uncharacterized membrane protein YfcA